MRTLNTMLAIACVATVLGCTQVQAQETTSPAVRLHYDGNWPSEEEGQQLRDELYYNQAIQAYMTMLPALNTIGMRDGSEKEFGAGYNVLPMWKDRMDAKSGRQHPIVTSGIPCPIWTSRKPVHWLSLHLLMLSVCSRTSSSVRSRMSER